MKYKKKTIVENCRSLSIFFLKEHGYLDKNTSGIISWTNDLGEIIANIGLDTNVESTPHVRINYGITNNHTGQTSSYDYQVSLAKTNCHLGGTRYWFVCPLCKSRRAAKLYMPPGGGHFGCRHCYNLTYQSRNETHSFSSKIARAFKYTQKADDLYEQITHWGYRDKPTRKAKRYYAYDRKGGTIPELNHG